METAFFLPFDEVLSLKQVLQLPVAYACLAI